MITYLDTMPSFNRSMDLPVRMPIVDRYKVIASTRNVWLGNASKYKFENNFKDKMERIKQVICCLLLIKVESFKVHKA